MGALCRRGRRQRLVDAEAARPSAASTRSDARWWSSRGWTPS